MLYSLNLTSIYIFDGFIKYEPFVPMRNRAFKIRDDVFSFRYKMLYSLNLTSIYIFDGFVKYEPFLPMRNRAFKIRDDVGETTQQSFSRIQKLLESIN